MGGYIGKVEYDHLLCIVLSFPLSTFDTATFDTFCETAQRRI